MTDVFTNEQRSNIMSHIHGKDTSIEIRLRKALFAKGFRFRKNVKKMIGSPDIVLPKYKTVIFIHGCFWHRHKGCRYATTPKTRIDFWKEKFNRNIKRDRRQTKELIKEGWNVLVVWECELKYNLDDIVNEIDKIVHYMIPSSSKKLLIPEFSCFVDKERKKTIK